MELQPFEVTIGCSELNDKGWATRFDPGGPLQGQLGSDHHGAHQTFTASLLPTFQGVRLLLMAIAMYAVASAMWLLSPTIRLALPDKIF